MSEEERKSRQQQRRSRAEADQLAAEYEASGLTQLAFSKAQGIPLKTLARYVARQRRNAGSGKRQARMLAVKLTPQTGASAELTLVLAGDRRIEVKPGFDGQTLQRLMGLLERA